MTKASECTRADFCGYLFVLVITWVGGPLRINCPMKGDVEFDVKNRNSSVVFLFIKSKCANFAYVLLGQ